MATIPVHIIVRSTRLTSGTPLIRVRSRQFQNPLDNALFADGSIVWHMVMNPFYTAQDGAAALTAEVDRKSQTTVRIAEEARLDMAEAKRDLRSLVAVEMGILMAGGSMRMSFIPGTGLDGVGDSAVLDHDLGLQHEWIWYSIRTVHAHTE
jgi:hypothetical protein